MVRLLFLTHRYLGIALGLVITLWCLSGFVMMYVQYPDLNDEERLAGLEPLELADCCTVPTDFSNIDVSRFRLEMLDSRPVLRLLNDRYQYVIDLRHGEYLAEFDEEDARSIATSASRAFGLDGQPELLDVIQRDQWTVYATYELHRPLFHFSAQDPRGTEFYVSSSTGEVVNMTTFSERFWNWMGAVVHWLYPTVLRQHTYAWLQTVIWLTVVSLFLTVIGLYIGLRQFKNRRSGRLSPYRGWALWHHYAGLIFGLFTLTWLISGLFSVNPWGALEGRGYFAENQRLRGGFLDYEQVSEFVDALPETGLPGSTVRLEGSVLDGELYVIAADKQAQRTRLDSGSLEIAPLSDEFFSRAGSVLRPDANIREAGWLSTGDAYYFNHHEQRHFPVYRIQYDDGERIYLDSVSGELIYAVDRNRQWSRWIFLALHRGDFSRLIRTRPLWDLLMLPLMLGVTVGAITGTWLGFRRLVRSGKNSLTELRELDSTAVPTSGTPSST